MEQLRRSIFWGKLQASRRAVGHPIWLLCPLEHEHLQVFAFLSALHTIQHLPHCSANNSQIMECEQAEKAVKMMAMRSCYTPNLMTKSLSIPDQRWCATHDDRGLVSKSKPSSVNKERHEHMYMVSLNSEEFIFPKGEREITTDVSRHTQQHTHAYTQPHSVIGCSLPNVSPSTL